MRILAIALMVIMALPAMAGAQRDALGFGEALGGKITRGTASPTTAQEFPSIDIHRTAAGKVKVAKGELKAAKLPRAVRAALGYLVRWGRGASTVTTSDVSRAQPNPSTPVIVAGKSLTLRDVELVLPVSGLSVLSTADGAVAGVAVSKMTVKAAGQVVTGKGFLEMKTEADGWLTITRVEVTP